MMMILIGLNLVCMSLDNTWFNSDLILERLNIVFTFVYVAEFALNVIVSGFREYC